MKVSVSQAARGIAFSFTPEPHDPLSDGSATFASNDAFIETDIHLNSLHPDIVGIIALFMVGEFSDEIELDRAVSHTFAAAAKGYRKGKYFGPASDDVVPHQRPNEWVPGLSFSGGVDSYAALQIMPDTTECFFLAGVPEKEGKKHPKNFDSGSRACAHIRTTGRVAFEVRSDLEFVRSKVGLPDHLACAIPLLVHADQRSIGSVTFGSIAEAAYRTGSTAYTELKDRHAYRKIHDIFAAINIPVHNVVVGLSEVVTTKIVASGPFAGKAQSCMWGGVEPCGKCIKCVRKTLLEMAITGDWKSSEEIRAMLSQPASRKTFAAVPIKLENVFAYIASKCPHSDPFTATWKQRVRVDTHDVSWMEKIFPSSLNYMVDELRPDAVAKLAAYAEFMDVTDLDSARSFDLRDVVKDEKAMRANLDFQARLAAF